MNIDYSKITDNPEVIELLKQRIELENKIKAIDGTALIKHELELLSLPVVVVPKGTLCDDWIHQERVKSNDDKYCPLCGEKLQA